MLDRRVELLEKEGIVFKTSVDVGADYPVAKLKKEFDAICLACGSRHPRDLAIEGRNLSGVHFAMDYLIQSNKRISGIKFSNKELIDAKNKKVVVIGGGDTGADCVGTAHRQGASCVTQIEIMPMPAACRTKDFPWPKYPMLLKTSTSHEEGGSRDWSVLTKKFIGENGLLKKLSCVKVEFTKDAKGCPLMKEAAGSEFEIEADLAVLALGFLHPEKQGPIEELKLELDSRGNVKSDENYMTSTKGVFSAGDMRRGQSLVVWAIYEGRRSAHCIDKYLMGESSLPVI
jgi:glutamate synthase (NADPH/NADH) small chain